jgi:Spy/CpxP family protein refolding chaperone
MDLNVRSVTIALSLIGSVTLAAAQTSSPGQPDRAPGMSSGRTTTHEQLQLTPTQKSKIFQAVIREQGKVTPPPNVTASVGAEVPASIELHMLPDDAVADAPAAKAYRYTIVQNQVVLVDPINMRIVDVIRQ